MFTTQFYPGRFAFFLLWVSSARFFGAQSFLWTKQILDPTSLLMPRSFAPSNIVLRSQATKVSLCRMILEEFVSDGSATTLLPSMTLMSTHFSQFISAVEPRYLSIYDAETMKGDWTNPAQSPTSTSVGAGGCAFIAPGSFNLFLFEYSYQDRACKPIMSRTVSKEMTT